LVLDVTPPNKNDNNSSSPLVPSEKPSGYEYVTGYAGNVTITNPIKERPNQGDTNESGTVPVDVKVRSEPPLNLLTVLVVISILVAPVVLTIYCTKMLRAKETSRSQGAANRQ